VPNQGWMANVNSPGIGAGAAYASSTTATDVSPLPQFMSQTFGQMYAGQRWRLSAWGIYSNTSTPALTVGFYYGGAAAGTLLAATPSITTTTAASSWPWEAELKLEVRSIGSSGSVWCKGWFDNPTSLTAFTRYGMPATQTQPITINTTTNSSLTVAATWGTSSSSNTLTCEGWQIEQMN
jgi:hypothetical protein